MTAKTSTVWDLVNEVDQAQYCNCFTNRQACYRCNPHPTPNIYNTSQVTHRASLATESPAMASRDRTSVPSPVRASRSVRTTNHESHTLNGSFKTAGVPVLMPDAQQCFMKLDALINGENSEQTYFNYSSILNKTDFCCVRAFQLICGIHCVEQYAWAGWHALSSHWTRGSRMPGWTLYRPGSRLAFSSRTIQVLFVQVIVRSLCLLCWCLVWVVHQNLWKVCSTRLHCAYCLTWKST